MKRSISVVVFLLVAFTAVAQEDDINKKQEISVLGGFKVGEGPAFSVNYFVPVSSVLVGPVVEGAVVDLPSGGTATAIIPGVNICLKFSIPYGHIYGGVTGRYRLATDYSGTEFGMVLGGAIFFSEHWGVNFETGYRAYSVSEKQIPEYLRTTSSNVPLMVGVRYRF